MSKSGFYSRELETELETVKKIIIENISSPFSEISDPLKKLITSKSKMLRPAFIILSSKFGKRDIKEIYPLAAAMEMLHTATLIHDDIIDRAAVRRGESSLHRIFGAGKSVLMGDYLLSRGYRLILDRLEKSEMQFLATVVSRLCEGEIAESVSLFRTDITERQYLRRIAGKTASLFALSFHAGASTGGCGKEITTALRRCGYSTGMAFQIMDDVLDFSGSTKELGKPAGNDLREGAFTLPVIYAIKSGGHGYIRELEKLKKLPSFLKRKKITSLIKMTEELGGIDKAKKKAEIYTARALKEIKKLPESTEKDELSGLISELLFRKC